MLLKSLMKVKNLKEISMKNMKYNNKKKIKMNLSLINIMKIIGT